MPPLSLAAVKAATLEKLRKSLLTAKHAEKLKIEPMTESMAATLGVVPAWAGFKIPYFTPEGKVVKDFYRYRFWPESKPSSGWASLTAPSDLRYVQPKDSELHVYMPPLLKDGATWKDVMAYPDCDLSITEGELKSASVCANTTKVMLGLGGVFSWMSKRHGQELIPILDQFIWKGRRVDIVFDSDRAAKPLVQLAASRLALRLTARGARVYDVALPSAPDGAKQGVDDFLEAEEAERLYDLYKDAKAVAASLELHRLNDEVAMVWGGGAYSNMVRLEDAQLMTPAQFTRALYRDRTYLEFTVKADGTAAAPQVKHAAEEWLAWPNHAKVSNLTYAPGKPRITFDGQYNLYRPPALVPRRGDLTRWNGLLTLMFSDVAPAHLLWFKRWLAYPLRFPGTKLFSCCVVWSHAGGTGKNLLAEAMLPIYGETNCATIKSRHLLSDFNGWAEAKQFIIGDEITLDDKRHTSGDLKSMLTSRTVRINRKGIESYELPDCANYYLTSNDPVPMVLDQAERRTFVLHVPETPIGDAYGTQFANWVRTGGGAEAVAYHLLYELDLGDFSPTAPPPDTAAKLDLIANSRSDLDTWATALRLDPAAILAPSAQSKFNGASPASTAHGPFEVYTPEDLIKIYDPEDKRRTSMRAMGIALDRAGFRKARHNNGRLGNTRSTFWLVRGDDTTRAPVSSADAAKQYVAERPDRFTAPSLRDKALKKEKLQ